MITEDYVSFEVAKLLKEKGFDERTCGFYYDNSEEIFSISAPSYHNKSINTIAAPTLQMAMKWLRNIKGYDITIILDAWALGSHLGYYILIQDINSDFEKLNPLDDVIIFKKREEAEEAAIKYCLTNLI